MAEQLVAQRLRGIESELCFSNAQNTIKSFNGDVKQFNKYVQNVEKYLFITGGDALTARRIVYQTCTGIASDIVHRFITAHPQSTWDQLKAHLEAKFGDPAAAELALGKLRNLSQYPDECVQAFAERILSVAQKAYVGPGNHLQAPAVQRNLVQIFISGVKDPSITRALLRNPPLDLQAAAIAAANEQSVSSRFKLYGVSEKHISPLNRHVVDQDRPDVRNEEPMDCSHVVNTSRYRRKHHQQRQQSYQRSRQQPRQHQRHQKASSAMTTNQKFQRPQPTQQQKGKWNYKWDTQGKPICHHCGKSGHYRRDCRKLKAETHAKGDNQAKRYQKPRNTTQVNVQEQPDDQPEISNSMSEN
jgi:hypothetical protein